jgi:hypothetical protein
MSTTKTKPASASAAIRQLAEKHGTITPAIVLEAARKPKSPLHAHFLWEDGEAAEKYRLLQAANLIRRIKVEYMVGPERSVQIRAFHNVREEDESLTASGTYASAEEVMATDTYRDQLMRQCLRDIRAFREKYAMLEEVAGVLLAMDKVS